MTKTSEQVIEELSTQGYSRIPRVYEPSRAAEALAKVRELYDVYKNKTSEDVPFLNVGQPTLYNLQNKDIFFLKFMFEAQILQEILVHFLNDKWFKQIEKGEPNYILRSFIARSSNREMPLHIDSFVPYEGDHVFIMQFSIILQDQSRENGCTIVVPKSHHAGEYATQDFHKTALPIESKAGDVVIWDSRLWHGTTANTSDDTRWAIIGTFCRWWMKQHWNIPKTLPQHIYEQLTPNQKAILGFCSIPHDDETAGIDLKRGYDSLRENVDEYAIH